MNEPTLPEVDNFSESAVLNFVKASFNEYIEPLCPIPVKYDNSCEHLLHCLSVILLSVTLFTTAPCGCAHSDEARANSSKLCTVNVCTCVCVYVFIVHTCVCVCACVRASVYLCVAPYPQNLCTCVLQTVCFVDKVKHLTLTRIQPFPPPPSHTHSHTEFLHPRQDH